MREVLPESIGYLRVCGPLPCRYQKEECYLPVCVVKLLQLQQHVFGCRVQTLLAVGLTDILMCVLEDTTTPAGMGLGESPRSRTR
jgi:hypothetical protein